jgi:hypothetical protein
MVKNRKHTPGHTEEAETPSSAALLGALLLGAAAIAARKAEQRRQAQADPFAFDIAQRAVQADIASHAAINRINAQTCCSSWPNYGH